MKNKYLTIDVGGTKIEVCKLDQNYQITDSQKIDTQGLKVGSLDFIDELKKIIINNLDADIEKIGVSFKAAVNNGVITYATLLGGKVNYELEKEFKKEFGVKVKLENDVNAMAIAESKIGKGQDLHSFVLLNLGTGIKLAYFNNGKFINGFTGNTGEISQKEIIVPELKNKVIKIDFLVSGQGIENIYKELCGKEMKAKDIFAKTNDDPRAKETIEIFIKYFSQLLTDISYFYNPEKIIITGSVKKSADHFLDKAVKIYKEKTMDIFHFKEIEISEQDHCAGLGCVLD